MRHKPTADDYRRAEEAWLEKARPQPKINGRHIYLVPAHVYETLGLFDKDSD